MSTTCTGACSNSLLLAIYQSLFKSRQSELTVHEGMLHMFSNRHGQVLPTVSHYYFCLNYHRFVGLLPHNQNGSWIYPSEHLRSYSNLVQTVNFSLGGGLVSMDSNLHTVTAAGVCMFLLLNFNSLFRRKSFVLLLKQCSNLNLYSTFIGMNLGVGLKT